MIENALKEHDETKLQRLIENTLRKKVHHSFQKTIIRLQPIVIPSHTKVVEQTAAKEINPGETDNQFNNKIGKLVACQNFKKHVIQKRMQSITFTAPATILVKQPAEITVAREALFFGRSVN